MSAIHDHTAPAGPAPVGRLATDLPRRQRLSLDRLVAAAVDVAREVGADRLTMKDVAGRLGVGTMSLYYYVPDKSALLDEIVAQLYAEVALPATHAPWRDQVDTVARQLYAGFSAIPGLDPFVAMRQPPHEHVSRVINATLGALHQAGMEPPDASAAALVVLGFAVGRGTAAARLGHRPPARNVARHRAGDGDGRLDGHDADRGPGHGASMAHIGSDHVFDFGLTVLLDGLAQRVDTTVR